MDLIEFMGVLCDARSQIYTQVIEDLVTFNCTPEDAKRFFSAIDIYEKVLLSELFDQFGEYAMDMEEFDEDEEEDELPMDLN